MAQVESRRFCYDRPDYIERDLPTEKLPGIWETEYPVVSAGLLAVGSVDELVDVIRTCSIRGGTAGRHGGMGDWERKWYELKGWGMIAAGIRANDGLDHTLIKLVRNSSEQPQMLIEMVFDTKPKPYKTVTAAKNLRKIMGAKQYEKIFGFLRESTDL
jgi:hypothetical protein